MTSINGDFPEEASILEIRETSQPKISVVIPTVPSSDHSKVCEILQNQSFSGEYEILVINDASLGVSEARNAGLNAAKADIVAFTDDDCLPHQDWIKVIHRKFTNECISCLEGRVKGGINYNGLRGYLTCNLAVDRESALSIGGFRSEYDGWREDTEFGWRMERDAEKPCIYSPDILVVHPTQPRATFINENERLLRTEYPDKYDEIMNSKVTDKIYRKMQKYGLISAVNALRFDSK